MANEVNQKGVISAKGNQLKPNASGNEGLKSLVEQMAKGGAFKAALPSVITPERFTRIALSALSNNSQLMRCTPSSFLGALMNAAQLGLEPNTPLGQAYLIPYANNKTGEIECQFQIGYQGLLELAYRSDMFKIIDAQVVYEQDTFHFSYGINGILEHEPCLDFKKRGPAKYVYALYVLKNGGYRYVVDSIDGIVEFAKSHSKSYGAFSSPWQTSFEEMAKKTMLKRVLKYAPKSTEFAKALADDGVTSQYNKVTGEILTTDSEADELPFNPQENTVPSEEEAEE